MNCDEARTMLAGYADGELESLESDAVIAHLGQCGRCRQIVRDQQRVQHVLDAVEVPPISDDDWDAMGKRLRDELAGEGQPLALKTRSRIESLEPTPADQAPITADEARPAPARPVSVPVARPRSVPRGPAAQPLYRPMPRGGRPRFGWLAHLVGAAAAAAVVALALASFWLHRPPPLESDSLARQGDVVIMEIRMLDPDYNVVLVSGMADDPAAVWVVPADEKSG